MASRHPSSRTAYTRCSLRLGLALFLALICGVKADEKAPLEKTWYAGCFSRHAEHAEQAGEDEPVSEDLADCSFICDSQGYIYIAVLDNQCVCENNLSRYERISPAACGKRCQNIPDANLPCGGQKPRGWSVYRAAGPWIDEVEADAVARWVEPGYPTTLKVTVDLRAFVDIDPEPYIESEWSNTIELTWHSEGIIAPVSQGVNISANSSHEAAVLTVTFAAPGTFPVELRVRNLMSSVTKTFNVTVVEPKPRELQLAQTNAPWTRPSCIPPRTHLLGQANDGMHVRPHIAQALWGSREDDGPDKWTRDRESERVVPLVAVFANITFELEVSTAAGLDLVFDVSIWDGHAWREFRHAPFQKLEKRFRCATVPQECRSVVQEFIFKSTGIFSATVHVSNAYGILEKNITIVVMDQHIRDVSAHLEDPSEKISRTGEVLIFQLHAFTADRNFTFIKADFGDGTEKNASVRERQAGRSSQGPKMTTLFADYGDGCTLSLKFDHVYHIEGTFSPLITLFNNVSSVTVELEKPLHLVHEITIVIIKSPQFALMDTQIPFSVELNKTTANVTVDWFVYDKEGNSYANASTRGLDVSLTFRDTGVYKVVSKAFNTISSQTNFTIIRIHNYDDPVTGLRISCNEGPYVQVEQEITCKAFVDGGEHVTFHWDFKDKISNMTFTDRLENKGSIATHTYIRPGVYNVSVKAQNLRNELSEGLDQSIHVEVAVGCLNVASIARVLPGKPVNITATATRGTDLLFDLEIERDKQHEKKNIDGAQSHESIVERLDRHVRIMNSSTIFSELLTFRGSARAYRAKIRAWNDISNASRTLCILIREPPPKFQVVGLPGTSSSIVSLGVQTLDGAMLYREDLIFSYEFPGEAPQLTQVPMVTWELHSDHLKHSSRLALSTTSSPLLPQSPSYFSSSTAVSSKTTKPVPGTSNQQLVEGSALSEEARSRPVAHGRGIREETEGRGRRFRRVSSRLHEGRKGEAEEEEENGEAGGNFRDLDLDPDSELYKPDKITAGGHGGIANEGGGGTSDRHRIQSRLVPEARVSPIPGARATLPGTDDGSARLATEGEQTAVAVHVRVANEVGEETATLHLSTKGFSTGRPSKGLYTRNHAQQRNGPQLWHPTIASVSGPVQFVLQDKSSNLSRLSVNFGDGQRQNVSCTRKFNRCSWSRHFHVPGVYSFVVSLYGRRQVRRGRPLRSALVVEEPIKGLRLLGASDVAIDCEQVWEAAVSDGSHILYQWFLDDAPLQTSVNEKFCRGFSEPAEHVIRVKAFNDLGSAEATLTFSVRPTLQNVDLEVSPTAVQGVSTSFTVRVEGGAFFTVTCNFGDGQTAVFNSTSLLSPSSSLSSRSSIKSKLLQRKKSSLQKDGQETVSGDSPVIYQADISHTYMKSGRFILSVVVNNGVSQMRRSRHVEVEEAIGDIELSTNTTYIMPLYDTLVVTAKVHSGENLRFEWDFSDRTDPPTVESKGNTSKAIHTFNIPGSYSVSVTVSNHVQSRGVKVSLPQRVTVVAKISDVYLEHSKPEDYIGRAWTVPLSGPNMTTKPVHFKARSRGSSVIFTFDFGDGQSVAVKGRMEKFPRYRMVTSASHGYTSQRYLMVASVTHVYTREGSFRVRLTAHNALSNESQEKELTIKLPPSGVRIDSNRTCVEFGEFVHVTASTKSGADVTYSWKLDDQTELIDYGPEVSHQYRDDGRKRIQVTAKNQYGQDTQTIEVDVMERILGLVVGVENKTVIQGKSYRYEAVINPPSVRLDAGYTWTFGYNMMKGPNPWSPVYMHTINQAGRHSVYVEAANCMGKIVSEPVPLYVVAPITSLTISVTKGIQPEHVQLNADYYDGTDITFTWDFGDGSDLVVKRSPPHKTGQVEHNYTRVGEYTITLTAVNSVSHGKATKKIFILNPPCEPPFLKIHFPKRTGRQTVDEFEIPHSEQIRLESEVEVDCNTSSRIRYRWEIWHRDRTKPIKFPLLTDDYFRFPSLLLPPGALQVGRYMVKLRVEMNGTEIPVYSEAPVNLTIAPAMPVSHIFGGILRHVGHAGNVWLDGRGSGFPHNSPAPLRYLWSCTPLESPSERCFNDSGPQPKLNGPQVNFPVSWLRSVFKQFEFDLSVSGRPLSENGDSRGGENGDYGGDRNGEAPGYAALSSQVITVKPQADVFNLFLECLQCFDNMVNPHTKISLRASSPWWPVDKPLAYTWEISLLAGDDGEASLNSQIHRTCEEADGSSNHYSLTLHEDKALQDIDEETTTNPSRATKSRDDKGPSKTSSGKSQNLGEGHSVPYTGPFGLPDLMGVAEAGSANSRDHRKPSTPWMGGANTGVSVIEAPQEPKGRVRTISGRKIIVANARSPVGRTECPPHKPDCIRRPSPPTAQPSHLVSRERVSFDLDPANTLTGLDQPSLVIKPGILSQGRSYFVRVSAKAQDGTSGMAMAYFKVNESPRKGLCTVRPKEGWAMETDFKVFCKGWQDEHEPLRYAVSFSLNDTHGSKSLYEGLRHSISFQLPEGLPENNHTVLLHVDVHDGLGAVTVICRIPIQVRPQQVPAGGSSGHRGEGDNPGQGQSGHSKRYDDHSSDKTPGPGTDGPTVQSERRRTVVGSSTSRLLYEEAKELHKLALYSTFDGGSHGLLLPLTELALKLNQQAKRARCHHTPPLQRFSASHGHKVKAAPAPLAARASPEKADLCQNRARSRELLLEALEYVPLRDEVETLQALGFIVETTDQPEELNWKVLSQAKTRLKKISHDGLARLSGAPRSGHLSGLTRRGLRLTVGAVSNLLRSLATQLSLRNGAGQPLRFQDFYRTITEVALKVLNDAIQSALQLHSIGETSLSLRGDFVSVNASLFSVSSAPPTVSINGMSFQLPRDLGFSILAPLAGRGENVDQEEGGHPESTGGQSEESSVSDRAQIPGKIGGNDHDRQWMSSCYQTRTISFLRNPFAFMAKDNDPVHSEVASLDVYNCLGTDLLSVQGLPSHDNVDIVLPRADRRYGQPKPPTNTGHYLDKTAMNTHYLSTSVPQSPTDPHHTHGTSRGSSTEGQGRGFSDQPGINHLSSSMLNHYLHVHIHFDPVDEGSRSFPVMVIISWHDPPRNLKDHVFKQHYARDIEDIKILLPSSSLKGGHQYHLGVVEASFNSGRRRATEVQGRNYTLSTWWSSCLFWNTSEERWSSNGCHVMPSSSVDELHCRCNHLTTFGSHFELIPTVLSYNDVDEFFFSLHENPLVVVLVALVLLTYMVGVLLLSSADAQDSRKDTNSCVYLQDNAASHHQKYEIALETGFNRHAGTTSKISIILHGEEGMSETRELISDDNRPMFECNSRDRFILTLPESLGRIQKIHLWHNNSGSSPSWYLRQAVVRDLNSGQAAYFLCQRWLAVDREDGKVEREFTAVESRNISFSMVFWLKGSQYLSDFHTWMSVLTRPPHSRFTRVQRLTVCLTLLSAYMCLGALWFKHTPQKIHREFGLLDLSWRNILVGSICCLIVVPLNLLLGFLFRRSRVHYPGYERDRALLSDLAKPGGAGVCDLSEGEEEQAHPQVTYSILDQSILNWQNIQDWAQKQWLKRQHSVRSSANSVKTSQTSPQLSAPSTTPLVQTLLAEYDTDHASSAWDASSRVAAEKFRAKAASDDSSSENVSDILNSSRRVFLPFWCRYLAWTLCVLIICTSITVTVMCGFRFGHTKGVMWIQSVYFSFIVCIFLVQPMLILLRVLHISLRHRKNLAVFNHYEDGFYGEKGISGVLNKQHSFLSGEDEELQRGVAARSRSRYLRFAGPPQEKQLKSSRKSQIKQKRALHLLRDVVCFIVMLVILIVIAFGKGTSSQYMLNKAAKQALVGKNNDDLSFHTFKSPSDWYQWSKSAIIDTLYSQALFSGEQQSSKSNNESHPIKMSGWHGLIVGQIQLRQVRELPEDCKPMPYFRDVGEGLRCLHSYNSHKSSSLNAEEEKVPYEFKAEDNRWLSPGLWGKAAWYDDSGYIVKLDQSKETAAHQLRELERSGWINTETRALFVEMTLYSAPTNLFSSVTLLMEITPPFGQIITSEYIMSTNLFRYVSFFDNVILACELLFIIINLWMIFHEMQRAVKMQKAYFYHFWNYLQLCMCTASLLYVMIYVYRFVLVSNTIETLRNTFYEEFVNISFICLCDQVLRDLVAIVLFCVVVKSLKILRYHQVFWRLQTVYRRCRQEIFLAGMLYIGLIVAFGSLATGLFGSTMYNLRSVWSSFLAMSALSIRILDWPEDFNTPATQRPLLGVILVFGYTFIHGFILTYIFAVLSQRMKKTRKCRVLALTGRQLVSFYWDTLLKMTGLREEPLVEQTDNTLPAEFTMAEILYLVEELLFRMNAVLGTSGLPDKHHSFSDSDTAPNGGEDGISSGGSMDQALIAAEGGPFLSQLEDPLPRLEQRLQKIEDKLCSQEPYLAQLLKLDSIGADVLSEEKEQELRSHLEFEIFRQLQMQRRETAPDAAANSPHDAFLLNDPLNALDVSGFEHIEEAVTNLLSRQSSTSKSNQSSHPYSKLTPSSQSGSPVQQSHTDRRNVHQGSAGPSEAGNTVLLSPPKRTLSMKMTGKQTGIPQSVEQEMGKGPCRNRIDLLAHEISKDESPSIKTERHAGGHTMKIEHHKDKKDKLSVTTIGAAPTPDKRFRVDVVYRPDGTPTSTSRSGGNSSGKESDTPSKSPLKHKQGLFVGRSHYNMSSGNASPQSSESDRGHKQADSSNNYTGHDRSSLLCKKPEISIKSSYTKGMLPALTPEIGAVGGSGVGAGHVSKPYTGWIPRPRQFKFLPELINPVGAESSSGSEQEVTLSRNRGNLGKRNLRKTKSRGKGKGSEGGISAPIDLTADFGASGQSGGSDFDIIIHRVPSELDPEEMVLTEDFPNL